MNDKNDNRLLLLLLVGLVVAGSLKSKEPNKDKSEHPTRAGLAVILEAFAFNLEKDGQLERPVLQWSSDVGEVFNLFGSRSTLGRSYRDHFASEFDDLGAQLSDALEDQDEPQPLTAARRSAAVSVLRRFARGLE